MGSIAGEEPTTVGLGNQVLLDKIDKLRELNVRAFVSLPQLVVVGDQSSGKSSVLESLTGFPFSRAAGLCTRYATQITCRRETKKSVSISIIPRPDADDHIKNKLRSFHRFVTDDTEQDFGKIFEEANRAMGIRPATGDLDDGLITFSEDILKIEISGPEQPHLTVIDVPGIFRAATPGVTIENDITLVKNMVKGYMKDSRTIILAVVPCNVDIATQEILEFAKDADPDGVRTMGVLTKPDLAPERATQQNILDLVQGKRNDLKLGYCVVKNRGADDQDLSLRQRNEQEKAFFRKDPWFAISSSKRVGIESLKTRLRELLMDVSKKAFPILKAEITKKLTVYHKRLESMGLSRRDEKSQRAYLGKLAANFERTVGYSLNAYYTEDPIFSNRPDMRLITRIIELNDVFSKTFAQRGHTRYFDMSRGDEEEDKPAPEELPKVSFAFSVEDYSELAETIMTDTFECPKPSDDSIMDHIEDIFRKSRGPELGTFGGALLGTTFKEQSQKWEDLVLSHVSNAIVLVHHFIVELLDTMMPEKQVRDELWNNVLLEKLQAAYKQAMDHARFLLNIEREGKPITYNHYFNANLQKGQAERLRNALDRMVPTRAETGPVVPLNILRRLSINKSSPEQVREYLHDILKSYYKVSVKRFVDVICQQVIDHFLLNGEGSPLHVFCTDLVFDLSASQLEMIAGEDQVTKQEREHLNCEIESLEAAMKVLRG